MSDPAIEALNATPGKHWWQSRTIWGLIITGVSIAAPKYQPVAGMLPDVVDHIATAFGLILAGYGRIKAEKPINNPLPK